MREELLDALREASRVLADVGASGAPLPDSWRWPLVDELSGLAAMLHERAAVPEGVEVLRIPAGDKLDAIIVYFEDEAPGQGRMTIACYGDAWTAWWGSMGDRTVRQFVAGCDAGYLSGALLQMCGGSRRDRDYAWRVAARVISVLSAAPQPAGDAVKALDSVLRPEPSPCDPTAQNHGFDRTASHSAGTYVCECGGNGAPGTASEPTPSAPAESLADRADRIADLFDEHRKGLPDSWQDWGADKSRALRRHAAACRVWQDTPRSA